MNLRTHTGLLSWLGAFCQIPALHCGTISGQLSRHLQQQRLISDLPALARSLGQPELSKSDLTGWFTVYPIGSKMIVLD